MEGYNSENGDVDKIQVSVQRILSGVKNEDNHMNSSSPSIYMAFDVLRQLSPSSFNPRVVSIGPLHREDENVQAFERQKGRYLMTLMSRIGSPPEEILESCMQKAYVLMDKIKASYVWTKTYGDNEIAEMMVTDACFILEFVYDFYVFEGKSYFRSALLLAKICDDLVLLENQIPFFFLQEIFQCTIFKFAPDASLIQLIRPILLFVNPFLHIDTYDNSIDNHHHILSLLHQCYKPPTHITSNLPNTTIYYSVVDLERAGVNFEPYSNREWVIGMKVKLSGLLSFIGFWGKPTFQMPLFIVREMTESFLRNLIAYEQSFQTGKYITSYVIAMYMLVRTQEDVAKLVQSRVLINYLGTNEEVANLINNISKEVATDEFYYGYKFKALNQYWDTNIAWVRRTYFIGPWNIISLIAGIILFFLTVVQTILYH